MMRFLKNQLILLLLLGCHFSSTAQSYNATKWMEQIEDKRTIASLSLPGAHDAATGEGLYFSSSLGVTQKLTLSKQWAKGVRAFDLRPAVQGTSVHIYHGALQTKISFTQAIDTLISLLAQNPSEFAIVLMREESESENEQEHALWPSEVGKIIENLGEKAAFFTPAMNLGEARGKILFLSRTTYSGTKKGAFIKGWNHSKEGTTNGKITSCHDGATTTLQIQDFYAPTYNEKYLQKKDAVIKHLSLAATAPTDVWSINFVSGYSTTLFGCTSIATTHGYKLNAERMHPTVIDFLSKKRNKSWGIIFMDFAGTDKLPGNLWHWNDYNIQGERLLRAIIDSNF